MKDLKINIEDLTEGSKWTYLGGGPYTLYIVSESYRLVSMDAQGRVSQSGWTSKENMFSHMTLFEWKPYVDELWQLVGGL